MFFSAASLSAASIAGRQDSELCLPIIDEVRQTYALYDIEGVTVSDGSMRVSIYNKSAELVFESRFPVKKADGKYFEWKYYYQPVYSMSRRLDPEATRTLRGMIYSAKDVVRAFHRGFVVATACLRASLARRAAIVAIRMPTVMRSSAATL